jgi:hypothetical protein
MQQARNTYIFVENFEGKRQLMELEISETTIFMWILGNWACSCEQDSSGSG